MNILLKLKAEQIFIPKRFQQVVVLHILKNLLRKTEVKVPLILGIHGPSGEGKTFQLENILKNMGVKRYLISGGQLDTPQPGQSAQIVRSVYLQASEGLRGGECSLAALLINDIDTGLGMWGKTPQFTMTQQTVFADLMHLVDYPTSVEGKDTTRVPIVITGNDFTRLYQPLVRAGRMTLFEWIPSIEERSYVVAKMFPELTREDCQRLIIELTNRLELDGGNGKRNLPVAFYSHLRATMVDEILWEEVGRSGISKTVDEILRGSEPEFSSRVNYDWVFKKALELAGTSQMMNHLPNNGFHTE